MVETLNFLNAGGGTCALYNEALFQNGRQVTTMESIRHAVPSAEV
jgi:hypothetical protein